MITIVVGKPGAGKSYDTTDRLVEDLIGRYRQNAEIPVICTNLKLNRENFESYISKALKREVDLNIVYLDDEFLSRPLWWCDLPPNSRIILDEAQFYLSSSRINKLEQQNLIESLSTHRHRRQDWILLTQSLTSVSVDVRRYCENVIEVLNAKSISLPFPLSISLRDVQILLWGFGVRSQVYRTREGLLEGTFKVAWEGELIIKKTRRAIYKLYKSTERKESGDSALPFADGPGAWKRALRWFLFKHGFRFFFLGFVFFGGIGFLYWLYQHNLTTKEPLKLKDPVYIASPVDDINYDDYIGGGDSLPIQDAKIIGLGWAIQDGKIDSNSSYNPRR